MAAGAPPPPATATPPSAVERFKAYFADRELAAGDLPLAIAVHEVLGLAMALSLWSACYYARPSRALARPLARLAGGERARAAAAAHDAAMARATALVRRLSWLGGGGAAPPAAGGAPTRDVPRLTAALAESLLVRAAIKPATFVFKLWLSWRLVLAIKGARVSAAGLGRAAPAAAAARGRGGKPAPAAATRQH